MLVSANVVVFAARLGSPWAVAGGGCCALVMVAVGALLLATVVRIAWRRWAGDAFALDAALAEVGYDGGRPQPDGSHERIWIGDGIVIRFRDGPAGHTWTGALSSYAPGEVQIEERPPNEGWPPPQIAEAFSCGDDDLDKRFRFRSPRKSLVVEALGSDAVRTALLACARVEVRVQGDEITFTDPHRDNVSERWGRPVGDRALTSRAAIAAQVRVHNEIGALIAALAREIYAVQRL